ncbi:MAG: competence/damage-inducible protein A [Promethearchaeota archaeon]
MNAEIILIGNELLVGTIKDSNGYWLIHQLLKYGIRVDRITIIPDDIKVISETLREAIKRRPAFIFTSGGLGPTYDDMTYEGIAHAFNLKVELNEEVLEHLKARYEKLKKLGKVKDTGLNESRRKMAYIPPNAIPLENPVGAAPGLLIKVSFEDLENKDKQGGTQDSKSEVSGEKDEETEDDYDYYYYSKYKGKPVKMLRIIVMPGFPDELQGIFNKHVIPILEKLHSYFLHAGIKFEGHIGESTIANKIKDLRREYPEIWIKTAPQKTDKSIIMMEVHLTTFLESSNEEELKALERRLKELRSRIIKIIEEENGKIKEIY